MIEVPVVHCTYFVKNEVLPSVVYDDNSGRYEYVIFSDSLRKAGIPQYIDNRLDYGLLTFCRNAEDFNNDLQIPAFNELVEYINKESQKIWSPK